MYVGGILDVVDWLNPAPKIIDAAQAALDVPAQALAAKEAAIKEAETRVKAAAEEAAGKGATSATVGVLVIAAAAVGLGYALFAKRSRR